MAKAKTNNGPVRSEAETEQFRNDKESEFIEGLADLMRQRQKINAEMAEIRQEAKDAGFSAKLLQAGAKLTLETIEERENRRSFEKELRELTDRLGILSDMPLGQAAQDRAAGSEAH